MNQPPLILFLCTGNSARSIVAECVFNRRCQGLVRAASAGSRPAGKPHPLALEVLASHGYDTVAARSKSWDEFAIVDAPGVDAPVVDAPGVAAAITLCDSAAAESCPVFPGAPLRAHWGLPDPAAIAGEQECRRMFGRVLAALELAADRLAEGLQQGEALDAASLAAARPQM